MRELVQRWSGAVTAVLALATLFYVGIVTAENRSLGVQNHNILVCQAKGFDQIANELFHHMPLEKPSTCLKIIEAHNP